MEGCSVEAMEVLLRHAMKTMMKWPSFWLYAIAFVAILIESFLTRIGYYGTP